MRSTTTRLFAAMSRVEERVLRATMPRTSAADPVGLRRTTEARAGNTARTARTLTYTLAEVTR